MNRKFHTLVAAAVLALGAGAAAQAANTTAPAAVPANTAANTASGGVKVGIIHIQAAIVNSNEGQRDFGVLQKKFEPKQTELKQLNDEIENLRKQLEAQGAKLNDEARGNMERNIQAKQKDLQRRLEDAENDFGQERNVLANRIGEKLLRTLDTYAKQNGYGVILDVSNPQSGVLWAGEQTNITDEVIAAYNQASGVPPQAPAAPSAGTTGAARPAGGAAAPGTQRPAGQQQPQRPAGTTTPR